MSVIRPGPRGSARSATARVVELVFAVGSTPPVLFVLAVRRRHRSGGGRHARRREHASLTPVLLAASTAPVEPVLIAVSTWSLTAREHTLRWLNSYSSLRAHDARVEPVPIAVGPPAAATHSKLRSAARASITHSVRSSSCELSALRSQPRREWRSGGQRCFATAPMSRTSRELEGAINLHIAKTNFREGSISI